MFSPLIKRLVECFQALPGIGPKSAQRMVFFLLAQSAHGKALALSNTLAAAITQIRECELCRIYTENVVCDLCQNPKRQSNLLCVVESPADVAAIEQTQIYNGLYFVLRGPLSPLDGMGPHDVGIPQLFNRLTQVSEIEEVILATNPTIEGKATAQYIANHINRDKIKCSRLAYGLPLGGELEYLDGGTLSLAFYSRVSLQSPEHVRGSDV